MHASTLVRGPDGQLHELVPGDMIGRAWSAGLLINDGRISEAHAMISLREGELQLVALRGRFAVGGHPLSQVALTPGLRVQLARDVELEFVEVRLPESVLGVVGPRLPRQALPGVCSLVSDGAGGLRIVRGWQDDAPLHVWAAGDGWYARVPGEAARQLLPGEVLQLGAADPVEIVDVPLRAAGPAATRRVGEFDAPLTLIAHYDSVHLHRGDEVVATFGGKQARLISELVAVDGPLGWVPLSAELWPDEPEPFLRRPRLDLVLHRIRARLRAVGVRDDLVRADRSGSVELLLHGHDKVVDRT